MRNSGLALLACALLARAAADPWTPADLWTLRTPRDPRISADGRQVVYLEDWNDQTSNSVCSNLWLMAPGQSQPRRLTEGPWRDSSPRWSPDGSHIAWISGRGGIHVLEPATARETAIDSHPLAIAWSPDGRTLAFTASVPAGSAPAPWAPSALLPYLEPPPGTRTAVFLVPSSGGAIQPFTGPDFEAAGEPAFMPDGKSLLIASAAGQIVSFHLADRTLHPLTHDANFNSSPRPSPNGARILWDAVDSAPRSYAVHKLYVMNPDGTRSKVLAGNLDRDPVSPQWSPDSRTVYFLADDSGATHVYASRADSTVRQVTRATERLRGFSLADNGRAVTVRFSARGPELVTFPVDLPPPTAQVLAAPMSDLLAARTTAPAAEIHFPSADRSIQAWVIRPPQCDPARPCPLLLDIADSPRRMFGPDLSLTAQIFAAHGWVVLRVNPRGTPGYGEEFGRLLPTRYPGDDADDLLAAVDFLVAKGGIDSNRIAVRGGLLAAWLIGHSDRFHSAIARRAIVDFTLEIPRVLPWMGALPWDDPEQYTRHSPIYFAQNWKTPTLIFAADPDPQSAEFLSALLARKVPAHLVHLPDAGKPSARVLELETTLAWLDSLFSAR